MAGSASAICAASSYFESVLNTSRAAATVAATSSVDYPRDLSVGAPLSVDGKVFTPLQLTDPTREAPISIGIQSYYDKVEIHEETLLLRASVAGVRDTVRVAVVATRNGSNIVTVLTDGVDFLGQGAAAPEC